MENKERPSFSKFLLTVISCIIFAISCNHTEVAAVKNPAYEAIFKINIKNDSTFFLNGKRVSFESFDCTAKSMIDSIEQRGIMRDQVLVAFYVDNNIELGVVSEFQSKLRDHNLRRITYAAKQD